MGWSGSIKNETELNDRIADKINLEPNYEKCLRTANELIHERPGCQNLTGLADDDKVSIYTWSIHGFGLNFVFWNGNAEQIQLVQPFFHALQDGLNLVTYLHPPIQIGLQFLQDPDFVDLLQIIPSSLLGNSQLK